MHKFMILLSIALFLHQISASPKKANKNDLHEFVALKVAEFFNVRVEKTKAIAKRLYKAFHKTTPDHLEKYGVDMYEFYRLKKFLQSLGQFN